MLLQLTEYEEPILVAADAAPSTVSCTESTILWVISPAKTGVVKNNEKARISLFICLDNDCSLFIEKDLFQKFEYHS
jgi:hypothetical protein